MYAQSYRRRKLLIITVHAYDCIPFPHRTVGSLLRISTDIVLEVLTP